MTSGTAGYGSGPMEDALTRMKDMRAAIMRELDAALGPRDWAPAPNQDGASRAGCNDGESETVSLRIYGFPGAYDVADRRRALDIVERVAREHGFDEFTMVADEADSFDFNGRAADGGSLIFGGRVNTSILVRTGCYRWAETPAPDAWLTLDPAP
jgi:hypothetical protein